MPPRISDADRRLLAAYHEAAIRLQRILQEAKGTRAQRMVLRRVDELLGELDSLTAGYVALAIPVHFRDGSEEAIAHLRRLSGFTEEIDEEFGTLHKEAIQRLADDAALRFASALEGVRRESQSLIAAAQKQKIVTELIVSEIEGAPNPAQRVKEILEEEGLVALRSTTRKWTLDDYASMLTHTLLAEAHNTGATTRYLANGVEFARIIERPDAPDRTCQWMRNKVVWLGDTRLLNPYHPHCMGGIAPFSGEPEDPILSADDPRIPADVRSMLLKRT